MQYKHIFRYGIWAVVLICLPLRAYSYDVKLKPGESKKFPFNKVYRWDFTAREDRMDDRCHGPSFSTDGSGWPRGANRPLLRSAIQWKNMVNFTFNGQVYRGFSMIGGEGVYAVVSGDISATVYRNGPKTGYAIIKPDGKHSGNGCDYSSLLGINGLDTLGSQESGRFDGEITIYATQEATLNKSMTRTIYFGQAGANRELLTSETFNVTVEEPLTCTFNTKTSMRFSSSGGDSFEPESGQFRLACSGGGGKIPDVRYSLSRGQSGGNEPNKASLALFDLGKNSIGYVQGFVGDVPMGCNYTGNLQFTGSNKLRLPSAVKIDKHGFDSTVNWFFCPGTQGFRPGNGKNSATLDIFY